MNLEDPLEPQSTLVLGRVVDSYTNHEGTVVLVGKEPACRVLRLSDLGALIVEVVGAGTTLAELAADLVRRIGLPPEGDVLELVRRAVTELVAQNVIVAGQGHKTDNQGVMES